MVLNFLQGRVFKELGGSRGGKLENIDDLAVCWQFYVAQDTCICIEDFSLVTDATENVGVQDVAFQGHELCYSYNAVKCSASML